MNGFLELKIKDRVIPCKWGTWAMKRICELEKITLVELLSKFESGQYEIEFISHIILASAEYPVRLRKEVPDFEEIDVYGWIDEMGGMFGGGVDKFLKDLLETLTSSEEKKSPQQSPVMEPAY